jgi:crotonobetaine/carnitine-CoA ligase
MAEPSLMIIANLVRARVQTQPELDVLTFESEGQTESRTYRQLWENGQRIAQALIDRGMRKGDRFALLLLNHPEFVETMIASAIVGTVFVPIDARARGAKLSFLLKDASCRGVICASYALDGLAEAVGLGAPVEWVYVLGPAEGSPTRALPCRVTPLNQVLSAPVPTPEMPVQVLHPAEPMQVMYTSGTTGDPKGIVVAHQRFGMVSNHGETVFGYRPGDRPYTGLSLTHGNGQFVTLAPSLKMGLRAVISRKFSKSRLWDIIRAHGCTTFSLLGGMITAIYSEPRRADDADNPVRLVISAGMPAAIWEDFAARYGVQILEFYGAVEGGMSINPPGAGPIGSCGRVIPGLLGKVVDEHGNEVPRGQPGELWFQLADAPFPAVSYLNNPTVSSKKTGGGWLRSGDVVKMDSDGWIFYLHRAGGGIRCNGEFVSPAVIEKTLAEHPLVDDVFVYGIPAASGAPGEKDIVAAVVAKEPSRFDPEALFGSLRGRLEPNMIPTYIQSVSEIPKTASEKPQERFLVDLFHSRPDLVRRHINQATALKGEKTR